MQKIVAEGGKDELAELFQENNAQNSSSSVVQKPTEQLMSDIGKKFGINNTTTAGVAGSLIPQILSSLVQKAKDPNDNSFQIYDIVAAISGKSAQNSGIMVAISKYDGKFGFDQNADGKIDISDAMSAITKKAGQNRKYSWKTFWKIKTLRLHKNHLLL